MTWYALQIKTAQGDRAVANLQNQNVTCFYPTILVEKIKAGKRVKKCEALFPGYLFINVVDGDPVWPKLRSTRGVLRVVSFANKPAVITTGVIEEIRASLTVMSERGGIRPGQSVDLVEGVFKGITAVFSAYDGDERAIVLMRFMQKQQTVKVPVSAIGRVF